MKKEDDIDQLFKKGLEEPDIPFNELDWNKMAAKLDASKTSKDRSLWYAMAGIAARHRTNTNSNSFFINFFPFIFSV